MKFPNRFKEIKGYKFDRLIFNVYMIITFAFMFYVAGHYNFNLDYYVCTEGSYLNDYNCENPFYKSTTWKNEQFLPPGEYGTKPGKLFYSIYWVAFGGLLLAIILNHRLYNKDKRFNLNETDNDNWDE